MMLTMLFAVRAFAQRVEPRYDPEGTKRQYDSLLRSSAMREAEDPSKEDVQGRWDWFYFQRAYPYDVVPAEVRTQGIRATQAMEQRLNDSRSNGKGGSALLAAKQWEQIGPYNITGRIRGLAVDPKGSGFLFVGAASGGVWRNNGQNPNDWWSGFDKQPALATGAVAIDPQNSNVVYAATGEPLPAVSSYNASPAYWGDGVFKSTDGGQSWFSAGLQNVASFSKIYVHRQNPNIVYAAGTISGGNLYRSEDGGQTWTAGFSSVTNCFDMAVNPKNSNTVFVTTTNAIYRSYNGGKTGSFTNVLKTSEIPVNSSRGIAIAISASDTNILYVLTARNVLAEGKDQGDVYVSTNSGTSWKKVKTFDADFFRDQGYYDNCIAVHPADPDIVIAGGVTLMWTNEGRSATGTWTQVGNEVNLHPDQHVIEFDPVNPDVVYVGNDGGLWVSYDGGVQWNRHSLRLPITQFYAIDVDQTREHRIFGGTQDNGTNGAITDDKFADTWVNLVGGDGFYCVVDKSNPNVFYGEIYYGDLTRCDGNNYGDKIKIDGSIPSNDNGQWGTPLEMSPADKTTLYQGRSALYRLRDPRGGSLTWETITPGNGNDKISAIGLSPFDATKMLIGTSGGQVRFSVNDGKNWAKSNGTTNRYVTDIVWDPVEPNRVYVVQSGTGGGHVFRSNDNGATFTNITSNLPDVPTNAIEIDPNNNTHIFVGNDVGAFVSVDGGQNWLPFNTGLPYVPVSDLKVQRATRKLYAGTYGRSVFRIDIDNPEGQPFVIAPAGGATVNAPGTLPIRWAGFSTPVRVQISYDNGQTWVLVSEDVAPGVGSVDYQLPIVSSKNARIRITEKSTGTWVESGTFSINAVTNAATVNIKSVAEAIAVRKSQIWFTVRNTDSIRIVSSVGTGTAAKIRSGFTGKIRDLAYDETGDVFYALVTDASFENAHVYRMDTNAVNKGEITLPGGVPTQISGIAMTPQGLALVTPGAEGKIYVIDPNATPATLISQSSNLVGASGARRIGLTFDGQGFVQGVVDARAGEQYPSELQLEKVTDQFRVHQRTVTVTPAGGQLSFFAVEFDPTVINGKTSYLATDTAGTLYRFTRNDIFSGVEAPVAGVSVGSAAIATVTPNPLRGDGTAVLRMKSRSAVTLDLYTSAGDRVARLFDGIAEQGETTVSFNAATVASGVYYMTLTTPTGDRDVRPVVVVR